MSQVFISHVEEDADVALEIALGLEKAGYSTWCYELDSIPGPSYLVQTGQAIQQAKAVVLIISPSSLGSRQVTQAVVRAHETSKYFIPVLRDITHVEFQNRQPEWREAVGAATSIRIPAQGVPGVLNRVTAGLKAIGIEPKPKPDSKRIAVLRDELSEPQLRGASGESEGVAETIEADSPASSIDYEPEYPSIEPAFYEPSKEAEEYTEERGPFWRRMFGKSLRTDEDDAVFEHPDVADDLDGQGREYQDEGKYSKALPFLQRALAIRERAFGPNHHKVADSLNNLAMLYRDQGRYAEALPLQRRALAIDERNPGPDQPDLALTLKNLALIYHDLGEYNKAVALYQRALAIYEQALEPNDADITHTITSLAVAYDDMGKHAEALPLFKRSLSIREHALGPDDPEVAASLNDLAVHYYNQDKFTKALPHFERALSIAKKSLGSKHTDTKTYRENVKECQDAMR